MTYKGYIAKIEFDEEAKVLYGEVAGIRDVITFQANAAADIEKQFRVSVDDYLAFCKERGESPEKPASGKFVVRVDPELHRRLTLLAEVDGTSLNALVEEYLGAEVYRHLNAPPKPKSDRRPATKNRSRDQKRRQLVKT